MRHFGKDGLGGSPGLGLGRPGAGGRLVLLALLEILRLILEKEQDWIQCRNHRLSKGLDSGVTT